MSGLNPVIMAKYVLYVLLSNHYHSMRNTLPFWSEHLHLNSKRLKICHISYNYYQHKTTL